ncbi:hypothetical protein X754_08445 [Mesorhizobium sp. LNJC403B00]|nr:hypothetical protein X754_08445 [Mesorhizobium sp. LNJC403B00]
MELLISPLAGEMAGRPEGSVRLGSAYLPLQKEVSAPREATPSVAFGDISPSRGEISC